MATIRPEDVSEWVSVRNSIAGLVSRNISKAKAENEAIKARSDTNLQSLRVLVTQRRKQKVKDVKDLHRIEHKGVKRLAARLGGHLDEKLEKEQQEAAKAAADLDKAEADLAAAEASHRKIFDTLTVINRDEATLSSLYDQQKAIISRVFTGPSGAGDELEKRLQSELTYSQPEYEMLERRARDYTEASKHLTNAVALCGSSLQFLQQCMQLSKANLVMDMGPRNGGLAGDVSRLKKMKCTRQAGALMQSAAQEVLLARVSVPEVTPIDPGLVQVVGGFANVVFDSAFTDIAIMRQVKDSIRRVEPMYMHLRAGQVWVAGVKAQADAAYYASRTSFDAKTASLKQHRFALMESAASGRSASAQPPHHSLPPSAEHNTAPNVPSAAPPPPTAASQPPGAYPPPAGSLPRGGYPSEPTNYAPPVFTTEPHYNRAKSAHYESPF